MSEKYRYDLHVHTYEGSACAKSLAAELADFYKEKGYAGVVVTDHFFRGNTRVDRSLPWPEWLKGFKEGYEKMKARGDEIGLSVFYGWEYSFEGIDFLTFGLDNDWLLAHPEVKDMDIVDYLTLARESGAYIIHAHPFFEARYIPYIRLLPHHVDAVEVCNAPKRGFFNDRAMEYATAYDLTKTGGSDCHGTHWKVMSGIELSHPVSSIQELIAALRAREHQVFLIEDTE
ncbi:MAG: PHP domain-containing protein [Firmicutes bacterium]|nr:PHP domain-containing protein [Bacillota bacterium]